MAFEIVAVGSAYCCRNTCHRQLMREQTALRFLMRLNVTFSNSIYLELTRKDGNSGAVLLQQCLESVNTFISEWCSEARPFRHLNSHVFQHQ